jgi:hypothetical protein
MDTTVHEENYCRTPTVLGHQPVDLLRAATVPAAPVVVTTLLLMVMLEVEAATAGAPHTELAGELVAEATAETEATPTTTSPALHAATTTPVVELKKYDATSPPRQARMMASPPSLLGFAICFS